MMVLGVVKQSAGFATPRITQQALQGAGALRVRQRQLMLLGNLIEIN